jgi:peptidoglycan/xylan/chitin deacetylase (PgdA/CDA1 family)
MKNLWSSNTPARFWLPQSSVPAGVWQRAIEKAVPFLGLPVQPDDIAGLLAFVLGEGQFGPDHWRLSWAKHVYYMLKPVLPRPFTCLLRRVHRHRAGSTFPLGWPVEARYVRFQWEVMRQLLIATDKHSLSFVHFWPQGQQFAFVLTHDIETAKGQANVRAVADLDESFGFRSSFNFVPERYSLDDGLIEELRQRGFEVGVHGLNHDGKLFGSRREFMRRVKRINRHLKAFGAAGFRSPCTLRHPEWMQALDIEYDLSFFDTDPYEPIPGGVMSIWPFTIGRFVELPFTLAQDCTLTVILRETTARLWLRKVGFIQEYHGMVLVNTHPDYLLDAVTWNVYAEFLQAMKQREGYWHALPRDVARWWRARSDAVVEPSLADAVRGNVKLAAGESILEFE